MNSQQPYQQQQVSNLPKCSFNFADYLKQDQEIRASFGAFVPLPVKISYAREKALAWVFNICETVHMSTRGLELLVFIADTYWEIEKENLPFERIAWICDEKYPLEELLNHVEILKQHFHQINSYVTSSVLLQATGIALNEEEYKIAEIFFFQTYKEAICLDALAILYVIIKFLQICCFIQSDEESIEAILSIITVHINPSQRESLDAIAEEMNQLSQRADIEDAQDIEQQQEQQELICCFNDERCTNEGIFRSSDHRTTTTTTTSFFTLNSQNNYQNNSNNNNNQVLQNIQNQQFIQSNNNNNYMNPFLEDPNYSSIVDSIQKYPEYSSSSSPPPHMPESACMGMEKPQNLLDQPMIIETLQNSSELMGLYTNNNNNNNNNNSYSESGVFLSSHQLNDLDLRTYHSNTTANSNYNSSNNNNNNNQSFNIVNGTTQNACNNNINAVCNQLYKVQEVQEILQQKQIQIHEETTQQTLEPQLAPDVKIDGEDMQEE